METSQDFVESYKRNRMAIRMFNRSAKRHKHVTFRSFMTLNGLGIDTVGVCELGDRVGISQQASGTVVRDLLARELVEVYTAPLSSIVDSRERKVRATTAGRKALITANKVLELLLIEVAM
jgi:DNA-binding MarR family transcriptional regulator